MGGLVKEKQLVRVNSDKLFFSHLIIVIDILINYHIEIYSSRSAAKLDKIRLSAAFLVPILIPFPNSFIAYKTMYK